MSYEPDYIVTGLGLPDTIQGAWNRINENLADIDAEFQGLESGYPEIVLVDGGEIV
jgi:non-canonical (house-cleaning) NTP pyrophosphatase